MDLIEARAYSQALGVSFLDFVHELEGALTIEIIRRVRDKMTESRSHEH